MIENIYLIFLIDYIVAPLQGTGTQPIHNYLSTSGPDGTGFIVHSAFYMCHFAFFMCHLSFAVFEYRAIAQSPQSRNFNVGPVRARCRWGIVIIIIAPCRGATNHQGWGSMGPDSLFIRHSTCAILHFLCAICHLQSSNIAQSLNLLNRAILMLAL